ncbi:MAG: hypothetical protein ACREHF_03630 [Rhizomicrobium sp.]
MSKACLLAAVCALALLAQGSVAARGAPDSFGRANAMPGAKLLYNQNSDGNGSFVLSQNFTSGNDAAADDFVVPKKREWTIGEVDVTGVYFNGSGPATSESVTFYSNNDGLPGKPVKGGSFTGLKGTDNDGSFAIKLPRKGLKLKAGHYWVSVGANCSLDCGEWGWEETDTIHGYQAVWESGGAAWEPLGADLLFDLRGKRRRD